MDLNHLAPQKAVARRSEVGGGLSVWVLARAGRSLRAFGCIANLYSQAGAVVGAGRRRGAEIRIRQETWEGVMRRSGRTFEPRVRGSSPRAGTTFVRMKMSSPPAHSWSRFEVGAVDPRGEDRSLGMRAPSRIRP